MKKRLICVLVAGVLPGLAAASPTGDQLKALQQQLAALQQEVKGLQSQLAAKPVAMPAPGRLWPGAGDPD
jgi:type II secretory pathway pseudopilin PulG